MLKILHFIYGFFFALSSLQATESDTSTHTTFQSELLYGLAIQDSLDGNYPAAIKKFRLLLIENPQSSKLHLNLAEELEKNQEYAEAIIEAKKALNFSIQQKKDEAWIGKIKIKIAGLYKQTDNPQEALKILKALPMHSSCFPLAAPLLLEIYLDTQPQEGIKVALKILKYDQNKTAPILYFISRLYQSTNIKKATYYLEASLQKNENYIPALLALANLKEKTHVKDAIKLYERVYTQTNLEIIAFKLIHLYFQEKSYTNVIELLSQFPDAQNLQYPLSLYLGLAYMAIGDNQKAKKVFLNLLERFPESDKARLYLASIYEYENKFENALDLLEQILPQSDLYQDALAEIIHIKIYTHDLISAKNRLKEAFEKFAQNPSIKFFELKIALTEMSNQPYQTLETLEKALVLFPENEIFLYHLGSLYDRLKIPDKSIQTFERLLKLNPNHVEALNYLGYTFVLNHQRLGEAKSYLQKAVRLSPMNGFIRDSLGWYFYTQKEYTHAIQELEKAKKLKPTEPTILEHLADTYFQLGFFENALSNYRLAVTYCIDETMKKNLIIKIETTQKNLKKTENNK